MAASFHEDLNRSLVPQGSSDRKFGLLFSLVFTVLALLPLRSGKGVRLWALGAAAVFLVTALALPAVLGPLNRAWSKVGLALGRITNPVITGLLFFVVIAPVGWLARRMGKDPLRLPWAPEAESYWIPRVPPGPPPESMSKQF
jgi:hypothetical protein